jgi:hypothetical protein
MRDKGAALVILFMAAALCMACKPTGNGSDPAVTPGSLTDCRRPDACRLPSREFETAYGDPHACRGSEKRVCLVPMGWLPKDLVDDLVAYYQQEYNLALHVLPTIRLQPGFDKGQMLDADRLRALFMQTYPSYAGDLDVNLIGLTAIGIYTTEWPGGSYGQTYPTQGGTMRRHAMLSIFMLDPRNGGQPANNSVRDKRIRVLMNRSIARGHFGLPENNDPTSLLYHTISSLGQLDRMDERIR